jgi:chromosome segregation ATPase
MTQTGDTRSPERARLAEAIAYRASIEAQIREASAALHHAQQAFFLSEKKLGEARDAPAPSQHGAGRALIAALRRGEQPHVAALDDGADLEAARLRELERSVATWARTKQDCTSLIDELNHELDHADSVIVKAARAVLRESGAVERLREGLTELEAEVIRRRLGLVYFSSSDALDVATSNEIRQSLMSTSALPGSRHWGGRDDQAQHVAEDDWRRAFEALKQNPDADLPL